MELWEFLFQISQERKLSVQLTQVKETCPLVSRDKKMKALSIVPQKPMMLWDQTKNADLLISKKTKLQNSIQPTPNKYLLSFSMTI